MRAAAALGISLGFLAGTPAAEDDHRRSAAASAYFPLAVGNQWVYGTAGSSKLGTQTITWNVTQREIVDGKPVYHLWPTPAQGDEPLSLSESESGIAEAGTERLLLRNPLHLGDRWTAKLQSLRSAEKTDAFEVVSLGKPCSVAEHAFKDCLAIQEVDKANKITSVTTYARGVGPVEYLYLHLSTLEHVDTTLIIKSWHLH